MEKISGRKLLGALTFGHMGVHWYQQIWPVIIPSVKATLGLTDVQLGVLSSFRQSATPIILPAGILADFHRKKTAVILAMAFVFFGVSHVLVAQAPTFGWIVPAVALLWVGSALWHPAAIGIISLRFPEKRASGLAVHGVGASIGDTIAPIVIGLLLLTFTWQRLLEFSLIPAMIIAVCLWKGLGPYFNNEQNSRPSLRSYVKDAKSLVRHRVVLTILAVNGLTGMGRLSVTTFLPIYIQDDLGYSALGLGFYWALLHAMGAISQPVMGYLSDRFGRKFVLAPSLFAFGFLYLALAFAGSPIQLIMVVGALGLFFYGLVTVTMAAMMDVASYRVQSSTTAVNSLASQLFAMPGPIIAGILVTNYGTSASFLFAGAVTLVAAVLVAVVYMPKPNINSNPISV